MKLIPKGYMRLSHLPSLYEYHVVADNKTVSHGSQHFVKGILVCTKSLVVFTQIYEITFSKRLQYPIHQSNSIQSLTI